MDKKTFEIWELWKTKQLNIDLSQLAEDLAEKGLAQSGIRNQKEAFLKEKTKAEIDMQRATMEAEETETSDRKKERKNQIRTNRISILITAVTVLVTAFFSWRSYSLSWKTTEIQLRPQFDIRLEHKYPNTASSSVDLIIKNQRGICTGFKPEILTFVEIISTQDSVSNNYLIPLDGYFSVSSLQNCGAEFLDHFTTTDGEGGIFSFENNNEAKFSTFSSKLTGLQYKKGSLSFALPPSHFVKITYQDHLGERRVYYQ